MNKPIDFMDLDREWFEEHRGRCLYVRKAVEGEVEAYIPDLSDPDTHVGNGTIADMVTPVADLAATIHGMKETARETGTEFHSVVLQMATGVRFRHPVLLKRASPPDLHRFNEIGDRKLLDVLYDSLSAPFRTLAEDHVGKSRQQRRAQMRKAMKGL